MSASPESAASEAEDWRPPTKPSRPVVATPGGDQSALIAVDFLEAQSAELRAAVSVGYARGRFELARDRKE